MVILSIAGIPFLSASAWDEGNSRQRMQPDAVQAIPNWVQVNTNGFGDPQTGEVTAVEAFNSYLYAGTHNPLDPEPLYDGAQIFRSSDGMTWNPVTQPGFGNSHDIAPPAILDFVVFKETLYASTGRGNASQIWRSLNGTTWAPMDVTGFSDPDNVDITVLAVYDGMIYAGVSNQVSGVQVWRSYTGDNNSWTQMTAPELVDSHITGFAEFDGALYAAIESESPVQIWRTFGSDWTAVINDGFGSATTTRAGGMAVFGGSLYAGAGDTQGGALLYRTLDGDIWELVNHNGSADASNQEVEMVYVFQNQLYTSMRNTASGIEIWRSPDGASWEQVNQDGFGDSKNIATNQNNATNQFLGMLYVGTQNTVAGGELWRMQLPRLLIYLPLALQHP